jgi:hypothetical protein
MTQILIGGDQNQGRQLHRWLQAWGLRAAALEPQQHPAGVPCERARAVLYACGPDAPPLPDSPATAVMAAPLLLIGFAADQQLVEAAWSRIADPGPGGEILASALRPCLEACHGRELTKAGFRDFLNHELRTPLTAAGTALQTLALQVERAGGQSLDLIDIALRNIRRLERTVDWACDYVAEDTQYDEALAAEEVLLTDLLQDLDDLDTSLPLDWSTGSGRWEAPVVLDRSRWRRLLRQILQALAYHTGSTPARLELQAVSHDDTEVPSGLLLNFTLAAGTPDSRVRRTGGDDEVDQLRRLLAFTVSPELARRLDLRFDVARLGNRLRLRIMVPLPRPSEALLAV